MPCWQNSNSIDAALSSVFWVLLILSKSARKTTKKTVSSANPSGQQSCVYFGHANPQLSVETTLHCYSHQQKDKVVSIAFLAATQRIGTVVWYLYDCKFPVIMCVGLLVGFDHEMAWFTWEPNNLKALIFKVWHPNKAYVAKNEIKTENDDLVKMEVWKISGAHLNNDNIYKSEIWWKSPKS